MKAQNQRRESAAGDTFEFETPCQRVRISVAPDMAVSDVIRRMVKAYGETPFRINDGNCDYFACDLAETLKAMGVNLCNSHLISAFSFLNFSFCIVTMPPLADWEKDWRKNPQRSVQPKLLQVDFRSDKSNYSFQN